jgi:hypothetical protein
MFCERCGTKTDANGVCGWCGHRQRVPNSKTKGGGSRKIVKFLLWTGMIAIVLTVALGLTADYWLRDADSLPEPHEIANLRSPARCELSKMDPAIAQALAKKAPARRLVMEPEAISLAGGTKIGLLAPEAPFMLILVMSGTHAGTMCWLPDDYRPERSSRSEANSALASAIIGFVGSSSVIKTLGRHWRRRSSCGSSEERHSLPGS